MRQLSQLIRLNVVNKEDKFMYIVVGTGIALCLLGIGLVNVFMIPNEVVVWTF